MAPRASAALEILRSIDARDWPLPSQEFPFHPTRKWRFDFAWPDHKLALEYEGGQWSKDPTRHRTGTGYATDCEKYSEAALLGWRVLRVTRSHVDSGIYLRWIAKGLCLDDGEAVRALAGTPGAARTLRRGGHHGRRRR